MRDEIGVGKQIIYHLLPGFLMTLAFVIFGAFFYKNNYPSILGFYTASILILFPIEIGLPVFLERRNDKPVKLKDIYLFRDQRPVWQIALLVIGTLLWAALVFLIGSSALVDPIRESLFSWVPEWYDLGYYLSADQVYSKPGMIFTWVLGIVLGAFVGPIIEEFYFRSYLLPRMSTLRGWAPFLGTVLMSLYHFWSPWLFFVRVIAMLPMVYAVWWKRNVYIGIWSHCLLNLIGDSLMVIPLIF